MKLLRSLQVAYWIIFHICFVKTALFYILQHGDCMMVRQCNFTSWPEHGVPETTAPIIHFVKLIRASRASDNTPMVVHCRLVYSPGHDVVSYHSSAY